MIRMWLFVLPLLLGGKGAADVPGQGSNNKPNRASGTELDKGAVREAYKAWGKNQYLVAIAHLAGRDLQPHPKVQYRRGLLYLDTARLYRNLSTLGTRLKTDLVAGWHQEREAGRLPARLYPCYAALDAVENGDFSASAQWEEAIIPAELSQPMCQRALVGIAAGHQVQKATEQARQVMHLLKAHSREGLERDLMIQRMWIQAGVKPPAPPPELALEQAEGLSSTAVLDWAWLSAHRNEWDQVQTLLTHRDFASPLAEEAFPGEDKTETLTRKYYAVDHLALLARLYEYRASEDLADVAGAQGEVGLYAHFMWGKTLQQSGDNQKAEFVFKEFAENKRGLFQDNPLLRYYRDLATIDRAVCLQDLGREAEALQQLSALVIPDDGSSGNLALGATKGLAKGLTTYTIDILARRFQSIDIASLPKDQKSLYREASIKIASCLMGGTIAQRRQGQDLMEFILRNQSNKLYLSVQLAASYYGPDKNKWTAAKGIIGGLHLNNPGTIPVAELLNYLIASMGGPGEVAPGQ